MALVLAGILSPYPYRLAAQKTVKDPAAERKDAAEVTQSAYPLRAIEIVGNDFYTKEQIIQQTGLKIGDKVTPADFQRGLERLNDAGVFHSVEFRYTPFESGYKLMYTVQEVEELYQFRADGFDVPAEEIQQMLSAKIPMFSEKVPPTGTMVERIGNALQEFWTAKGHDSQVRGRLVPLGDEGFEMLFQPESAINTIAYVKFENAGVLSPLDLQRSFNQVAMGVPYSEARLQQLLEYNVKPLYEARGRMEVKFCPCTTAPDPETKGLLVTVQIEQGEEYNFGSFDYPQESPIPAQEMAKLMKIKDREIVNMNKVREGLSAIEDVLKREGYMKASARYQQTLNTDQKTVDVAVSVDPGSLYKMDQLTIRGLDVITEPTVRKRWGLKPGDPFDAAYPTYFLDRIRDMFDNLAKTDSKTKIDEVNKTVDVELLFTGTGEVKKEPGIRPAEKIEQPFPLR